MPRSTEERLEDIRDTATDLRDFVESMETEALRDFVESMETEAFHALPHANRMGFRALKNAGAGKLVQSHAPPQPCLI